MKNPKWSRDEVILALDLYYKLGPKKIDAHNESIIQLSELLKKLSVHKEIPDKKTFRNANGVSLKLFNFLAIDPNYQGKGMNAYSRLDKQIFEEYSHKREELSKIASTIREVAINKTLNKNLYKSESDDLVEVREGEVAYRLHRYRERNAKINQKKKDQQLKKLGRLKCEVCGFDFSEMYGELGKDFIECHHKIPLADIDGSSVTNLDDLALVCSNCHSMLHHKDEFLSIEQLKKIVENHRMS